MKRLVKDLFRTLGFELTRAARRGGPNGQTLKTDRELQRLASAPDYTILTTNILGPELTILSNRAFVPLYKEIIQREIYRFACESDSPVVIDCGANIGTSVIYFKTKYPGARICCFEPAPEVFRVLQKNIRSFGFDDVTALQCGVWDRETELSFSSDPQSTGGHIVRDTQNASTAAVKVVRLRDYLDQPVHFLKMDIEGAESVVIPDISDRLQNVRNIFVEYHSRQNEEQTLDTILHELSRNGFRLYLESGPAMSPQPFYRQGSHKGMDLLVNIFGIRPH